MKVDMKKLMGPDWEPDTEPEEQENPKRGPSPYRSLAKKGGVLAFALMAWGGFSIYQTAISGDSASADALYVESEANPSFTVQHLADVETPYLQEGGSIPVLTGNGDWYAALDDGGLGTTVSRMTLYEEYGTDWNTTQTLAEASFLNGADGSSAKGYVLSEVWFGSDKDSENQSDFLVLEVPVTDGEADLSLVTLTNNPDHPGLSGSAGGYYLADDDGTYTVCVNDGDVIRLVFEQESLWEHGGVTVFDYDVSDGGYYLKKDYYNKGDLKASSGQYEESKTMYVDAVENGIHSSENYPGNGTKLAFGGDSIGTRLADEALDDGLDTINIWNYAQQADTMVTGAALGLTSGVIADDNSLVWADNVSAPDLFGSGAAAGKTIYGNGEYSMTFVGKGFTRVLSAVESDYGTAAEGLEMPGTGFWILDVSPTNGADGHDVAWGSESGNIQYYRDGDRTPVAFEVSDDGEDHDSFFGFAYTEDFILSPGYTGPLDFFGYSDDDLWAYAARVDSNGTVMTDTAVLVADLGGVHDSAGVYTNMWDVIDKVGYDEEAQTWRLFVFWLERDGSSAECYLRFTLPEDIIPDSHETGTVAIEAIDYGYTKDGRTFIYNDGTHNRYEAVSDRNGSFTIISGEEFTADGGDIITINGLMPGHEFTVTETGRAKVWASSGSGYEETDTLSGTTDGHNWLYFLSAAETGQLTVGVDAEGSTDGYAFSLTFDGLADDEVHAMDRNGNPSGVRNVVDGMVRFTLDAGEYLVLYDLPADVSFTLSPDGTAGWHVAEILLDGDVGASGTAVSGQLPGYAVYRFEANETEFPRVMVEQSVSGDWSTADLIVGTDTLISYDVTVTNPNDTPMGFTSHVVIPDGLEVLRSSLFGNEDLDGNILSSPVVLEGNASAELSFTCLVITEDPCEIKLKSYIIMDGETVAESNTVTAMIP